MPSPTAPTPGGTPPPPAPQSLGSSARVAYLHHSTGAAIWEGGVPQFIQAWNEAHGTSYRMTEITYPATSGGYPWANYPYDYWNLWVAHTGASRDRGEPNLDDLTRDHDLIVFKHCFPVSGISADEATARISSDTKTLANYRLQYEALKARMRQFPDKRFIVWTGAALTQQQTDATRAQRAGQFFEWVRSDWDERGDNIFVWDFFALQTEGGPYLDPAYATGADSHPNATFSRKVAPLIGRRIVDVIEGRGDTGSITGE